MSRFLRISRYLIPLILFAVIVLFFWRGLHTDPHIVPSVLIGKQVPNFNYPSLSNSSQSINEKQFLGHISLLNVWATWCITCHAEHPILMDIAQTSGISIYGLDYKDQRQAALTWLKKYGNPYKDVIYDDKGTLAINLGVYGTPETFVIDSKGIIRYKYIGAISPDVWQDTLLPEIKKLQVQG